MSVVMPGDFEIPFYYQESMQKGGVYVTCGICNATWYCQSLIERLLSEKEHRREHFGLRKES